MKRFTILSAITSALLITACSSNEIGNSKDVNPETVYMDYAVDYTEGDDSVTCFLQYRFAGENGTTLVLTNPSKTTIDGKEIMVDSSGFTGAYYQQNFEVSNFTGAHTITFTDINGKEYAEQFSFKPFICLSKTNVFSRNNFTFQLSEPLPANALHISIADTSAATDDVNFIDTVNADNTFIINPLQLQQLKNGPVTIKIINHISAPLQNPSKEGGRLNITYTLKPIETELKD